MATSKRLIAFFAHRCGYLAIMLRAWGARRDPAHSSEDLEALRTGLPW